MKVVFYDKYYDVPTRGTIDFEGRLLPFAADVHQESDNAQWDTGIPATLRVFNESPDLTLDFEFINRKFKLWKLEDPKGDHPLVADPEYEAAVRRIDKRFAEFPPQGRSIIGLFRVVSGSWHFSPDPNA